MPAAALSTARYYLDLANAFWLDLIVGDHCATKLTGCSSIDALEQLVEMRNVASDFDFRLSTKWG
jgi:hypothetical protein